MASVRKLKKDINHLAYELLAEAFSYKHFHPEMEEKKLDDAIKKLVLKRNELISKANNPEEAENEDSVKEHYRNIRKEMQDMISSLDHLTK